MRNLNIELEMKALDAEKAGMEAENQWRLEIGENIAYDDEAFCQLAEKYRALKEIIKPEPIKNEVVHEGLSKLIKFLGIGPATCRSLESEGIKLISDMVNHTSKELSGIRLVGRTTVKKIEHKLTEMGLKLKEASCPK